MRHNLQADLQACTQGRQQIADMCGVFAERFKYTPHGKLDDELLYEIFENISLCSCSNVDFFCTYCSLIRWLTAN